jgi:hypothetical protein
MTTTESPTATWPGVAGPESEMRRRIPNLIRLAGLSAVLAGLCYVSVGVFHPANALASVTTTRWAVVHVLACAMSFFGVLGMAGIYLRQASKTGWLGLLGFVLLSLWLVIIMGFSFVEAFVLPHIATLTPAFVNGWMGMFNGTGSQLDMGVLPTLWTLTAPVYILGGVSFGIATFRARILPRGAGVLLAIGTALAPLAALLPLASQPKMAIPTGVALAWLGYALLTERRNSPVTRRDDRSEEVRA